MNKVNGKYYPLWQQFIDRKDEFIGCVLEETDMGHTEKTIITDVVLEPNGEDSAMFGFIGEDFNCKFDVRYGGVCGGPDGTLPFATSFGSSFLVYLKDIK